MRFVILISLALLVSGCPRKIESPPPPRDVSQMCSCNAVTVRDLSFVVRRLVRTETVEDGKELQVRTHCFKTLKVWSMDTWRRLKVGYAYDGKVRRYDDDWFLMSVGSERKDK